MASLLQILRYEWQPRFFGFSDVKPESFYSSTWFHNRVAFVCYRCFMFLYTLVWSIYTTNFYAQFITKYYGYLSNWAEWSLVLYFGTALGVSIYGLVKQRTSGSSDDAEDGSCTQFFNDNLRWFHRLNWVFLSTIFSIAILVTIVFWSFLSNPKISSQPANVHQHAMNTVLIIIELFVVAIPIRLLHFIYPALYGITYTAFTLILHGAGVMSKFYPGLYDWSSIPGISAALCIGLIVVAIPITHAIMFGLYHLREFIARSLNIHGAEGGRDSIPDEGETNQAYDMR